MDVFYINLVTNERNTHEITLIAYTTFTNAHVHVDKVCVSRSFGRLCLCVFTGVCVCFHVCVDDRLRKHIFHFQNYQLPNPIINFITNLSVNLPTKITNFCSTIFFAGYHSGPQGTLIFVFLLRGVAPWSAPDDRNDGRT